jgi:hypothetical protein
MSPRKPRRKILGRRSVRARIALACAGLFLVTGGAFVAATYTLVDHSLSSATLTDQTKIPLPLLPACKTAQHNGTLTGALAAQCQKIFAGAAQFGAANQRAYDLRELLLWSLVGLGVATLVAGVTCVGLACQGCALGGPSSTRGGVDGFGPWRRRGGAQRYLGARRTVVSSATTTLIG